MAIGDYSDEMVTAWRDAVEQAIAIIFTSRTHAWKFRSDMYKLREEMVGEKHEFAERAQQVRISEPQEIEGTLPFCQVVMSSSSSAFPPRAWSQFLEASLPESSSGEMAKAEAETVAHLKDMGITAYLQGSDRMKRYLSASSTTQFIEGAKARGYATRDQLRLWLPLNVTEAEMLAAEAILADMGIALTGQSEPVERNAGPVTQLRQLVSRLRGG